MSAGVTVFAAEDSQFASDQQMIQTLMDKLGPFNHDAPDEFKSFWFQTHRQLVEAAGEFLRVQRLTALAFHRAEVERLESLLSIEPSTVLLPPAHAWPDIGKQKPPNEDILPEPEQSPPISPRKRMAERKSVACPHCGKLVKRLSMHIQWKHPELDPAPTQGGQSS